MTAVAVVGAGGFVGSRLLESLVLDGHVGARAIVRSYRSLPAFCQYGRAIDVRLADAENPRAVAAAVEGAHTVVNLTTGAPAGITIGTRAIVEGCEQAGVVRLVHLSSAVVFGDVEEPASDDDPPQAKHWMPYARAKASSELWLRERATRSSLNIVVLRPGIIWGPRSPHTLHFAKLLHEKRMALVDDGRGVFNGAFIDTLVSAIRRACIPQAGAAGFFNVGDAELVSWRHFVESIGPALGCDASRLANLSGDRFPQSVGSVIDSAQSLPLVNDLYHQLKGHVPDSFKATIRARLEGPYQYQRPAASYVTRPPIDREMWHLQRTRHKLPIAKFCTTFDWSPVVTFQGGIASTLKWLETLGMTAASLDPVLAGTRA